MILGIHHVGVSVSDLDRACAFYSAAFGFKETRRFALTDEPNARVMLQLPEIAGTAAFLSGPNMILEVFEFDRPVPRERRTERPVILPGITHFCVQSTDVASAEERFSAAGGRFHARSTDLGGDILYAYPRDPDGNVIELETLPHAGEEGCWLAHVSITTPDIDQAVAFYEKLTGATARRLRKVGPNPKVDHLTGITGVQASGAWLRVGNTQLELWQYLSPSHHSRLEDRRLCDPGYSHFAFEVRDVHEARAFGESIGMRFQGEPIEGDGVTATYGRDPDRNIVEMIAFDQGARRFAISALPDPGIVERVERHRAA
jgi:catechol 2,3-dioxygenase-like lactoylglutathione lyase family enzyme